MVIPTRNPFHVLATHRNFRAFWLGQTVSLVGMWMQTMAQGWLALQLTDDAFMVSLVPFAFAVPVVLLSLPAGAYADRGDRLRIVAAVQVVQLASAALLFWLVHGDRVTIEWLVALAALAGTCSAIEVPARQALVAELVPREELVSAIALNSGGFNLARIVGPALGAVVIARLGIAWCFGLNAITYLAALLGLALLRGGVGRGARAGIDGAPAPPRLAGAMAQLARYVWDDRAVRALMIVTAAFAVLGIPFLTLMPVTARDLLGAGPAGYGSMFAFVGVGGIAGALFVAAAGTRIPRPWLFAAAALGFPLGLGALALCRSVAAARPVLAFVGCAMIVANALAMGMLQERVPDALRGRLMAAYSLVIVGLGQLVGSPFAGLLAREAGPAWALGGPAIALAIAVVAAGLSFPELRRAGAGGARAST